MDPQPPSEHEKAMCSTLSTFVQEGPVANLKRCQWNPYRKKGMEVDATRTGGPNWVLMVLG